MKGISRAATTGSAVLDTAGAFRWLWAAAFALIAAANPIAGNAGALFTATATAGLEIVSISGDDIDLKINGFSCVCGPGGIALGNATYASKGFAVVIGADPDNLVVNTSVPEGLSLSAEGSGSASPEGFAFADFAGFASIEMENFSLTNAVTIGFRLIWSLSANANADNPDSDYAAAGASILVDTALFLLDEFVESDTFFGPFGPQSLSGETFFSLTLLPTEFDFIDIDIGAGGEAESLAVPEPGSWALLALGLALLRGQRRRHPLRLAVATTAPVHGK